MITCQTHDSIPAVLVSNDSSRPRFSISQVSTLTASFADDVRVYAAGGLDAIGIWETKLPEGPDDEALEQLAAGGLGAASAVPAVPSVLPLPLLPGPDDPQERIDAVCASIHRLAPFGPTAIVCLTGPAGNRDPDDAHATVVDGLRTIAHEAERAGMRIALEPFQREGIESWSLINTIPDAVELIDEVGSPALGIQFDVWHLWNTPDLLDEIDTHIHRFAGVHVNDWREPTRGWADRALPGDGLAERGRDSRRPRRRRVGRLLRPRNLLGQRRLRHGVPGFALGRRSCRARASGKGKLRSVLAGTEGGGMSRARRG